MAMMHSPKDRPRETIDDFSFYLKTVETDFGPEIAKELKQNLIVVLATPSDRLVEPEAQLESILKARQLSRVDPAWLLQTVKFTE